MAKCQIRLPCVKGGGIFAENDGGIVGFSQWQKVNTHTRLRRGFTPPQG